MTMSMTTSALNIAHLNQRLFFRLAVRVLLKACQIHFLFVGRPGMEFSDCVT